MAQNAGNVPFGKSAFFLMLGMFALASCQPKNGGGPSGDLLLSSSESASSTVVAMAKAAQKCWFKSGNPVFAKYRLAAEVNSYAGRPRFLIVPKNNPGGLPLLVVQAEKSSGKTKVEAFGPLMSGPNGSRISADIKRWNAGNSACSDKA